MESLLQELSKVASLKTFPKKRIVLFQGEVPGVAYVIKKGLIKAYTINGSGDEKIAAFYTVGDMLPITWIFNNSTASLYYYETVSESQLIAVSKDDLRDKLLGTPENMDYVINYTTQQYAATLLRITALEQSRANEKIMFTLYYLVYHYGRPLTQDTYTLKVDLTHNLFADMVGLTRETVSSELHKLKKAGIVDYHTKNYVINKPKLERLMGEDSFDALVK